MTPYFRRSMSPMERHGCRGRGEILSPKTHGHVLLRESRFQERVLGDQWDTYPRLEALCQSISEKRAFLGCATQWPWCHLSPKKWCRRATKFTLTRGAQRLLAIGLKHRFRQSLLSNGLQNTY